MSKNVQHHFFAKRPPIVVVLGHVDHGKTSLLDFIRKSDTAIQEKGGITQHIGAYQVHPQGKTITFIDTPGHEAFARMRSRGAAVADIAVLVVSAVDGVMPQTKEAINHIRAGGLTAIAAVNKTDLPEANIERVKKQLSENNLPVEGYGGETVVVPVSAKTGQGIDKLLEMILLHAEIKELKAEASAAFKAVVIESKIDRRKGPLAVLIVKQGTLRTGDVVWAENIRGKVRAMYDENNNSVSEALPGSPVLVLGFSNAPAVGAVARDKKESLFEPEKTPSTGEKFAVLPVEGETIRAVLKADAAGTLEAIKMMLPPNILLVGQGVGDVNESDIFLARTTGAIIIGFNVRIPQNASKLAENEKVLIHVYSLIYKLLEEIADAAQAARQSQIEHTLGEAKVIAEFPYDQDRVAGVKVFSGRLVRGDQIKIMRKDEEIGRARIKSMRHGKEESLKTEEGGECGIILSSDMSFMIGDNVVSIRS